MEVIKYELINWWSGLTNANSLVNSNVMLIFTIIFGFSAIIFSLSIFRKIKQKVAVSILPDPSQPRFRKRDKVMFYGRKMLRKVRSSLAGRTRGKKRQMVLRFAKKLLRLKREQPLQLQVKEPSQAFLEEDDREDIDQRLPPEVIYMLKGVRVFGLFDKPLFLELCKQLESIVVPAGKLLFSIGDPDDSIYIVQTGKLQVFLIEPDDSELMLKEVTQGDTIASLLSVMDVLTGHVAPFKTVSAKAVEDSVLLRLQVHIFKELLEKYPESLVRIVQVIMVRLQRVTLTALHNYLGLTTQLINAGSISGSKKSTIVLPNGPMPSSPTKLSPSRSNRVSVIHVRSSTDQEANDLKSMLKAMAAAEQQKVEENELEKSGERKSPSCTPSRQRSLNTLNDKTRRRKSVLNNEEKLQGLDDGEILKFAIEGFSQQLGVEENVLKGRVDVREYNTGIFLTQEDAHDETALFYIISGCLVVSQKNVDKEEESVLFISYPGEVVGALAVITGEASVFTTKTKYPSRIGVISRENTYKILAESPKAVLFLAHSVIRRLSPFVRQIDFALDWIHYESGRPIYRQGDLCDSTYIVLSGRLRSVFTRQNGKKELVGEYGRGDLVGIVEVLTQTQRSTTIMAVRDSELAKLPAGLLNCIKIKYPVVVTRLIHLLGHRILGNLEKIDQSVSPETMGLRPSGSNFATVALISVTDDVPLQAFSMELHHALSAIGPTLQLTSEFIRKNLGPSALDNASEYRLCSWLGQQEDQNKIVLYQCDNHFSTWTQRCIRQADCILIVALADQEPSVGQVEKQLERLSIRTQKELILLHKDSTEKPKNTVKWLNIRSWCSSHHHIRCPKRMFIRRSPSKIKEYYSVIFNEEPDIHSDFSRLARFLTGTSIGLVLGGGGARGAAHVGMIKAIKEAGIPVDMIGGVSIGAFMGALWCQENNIDTLISKARTWSHGMTSYWRQILDLTYPATAMFTGAAFNKTIHDVFGDRQIEDLWLPYFTVTTDITSSSPRVHRHGSLWRYVRSSMSLSGYLPPLCDPADGHLLLDGGYVNNLPADVMHDVMGSEAILAIDVGSQDDMDMTNYGDTLSGWWLLWKKWYPFCKPVKVPNLPEIQSRLAYVSCVRQLEQVKRCDYCTYIRPPIDKYKTLQFGNFDEIMEVGYNHGQTLFSAMTLDQKKSFHNFLQFDKNKVIRHQGIKSPSQTSFTDLAERVCKIQAPKKRISFAQYSEYSDEYDDDDVEELYLSEPDLHAAATDTDTDQGTFSRRFRKTSTMF